MAEGQKNFPVAQIYDPAFYQADAELNKAVFRVFESSLRGLAAGAVASLLFKNKMRVIWAGVGFGAGYEYYNAHLNFAKYKIAPQ